MRVQSFKDKLKKLFPKAKMIYRPSDPMVYSSIPKRVKKLEQHMLYTSDLSIIVNQEGVEAYRSSRGIECLFAGVER